jgi:hypothetical protein
MPTTLKPPNRKRKSDARPWIVPTAPDSRLRRIWYSMLDRCFRPANCSFKHYGGRGITVCERWRDFENFKADMGERPSPSHSLERKHNDHDYCPANCVWATRAVQQRNRRSAHLITANGETLCIAAWAERLNANRAAIKNRLARGWDPVRAVTAPIDPTAGRFTSR